MHLNYEDIYIYMEDPWDKLDFYQIVEINKSDIVLNSPYYATRKTKSRSIPISKKHKLQIYPFSLMMRTKYEKLFNIMFRIGDLTSAFLNKNTTLPIGLLKEHLFKHKQKYGIEHDSLEWTLRCLAVAKIITPTIKKGTVVFSVSDIYRRRENERKFSASIAGELESLSERVRHIVDHGPTVGTYRENLLQSTLRKHLPERYHVATGFINGLDKQLDILIYDRVDYAPVFREGDLVVVPSESVRAVIEVKTKLSSKTLTSALEVMQTSSIFDDCKPPFFRGVFSFESALSPDKINQEIMKFYTDLDNISQGARGDIIHSPFKHVTCVCVHKRSFSYIEYKKNKNTQLVPTLYSKGSASGLKSQTAFFIQSLLSYLKFGGMKSYKLDHVHRMLGEDTFSTQIGHLCPAGFSWGMYYNYEDGNADEEDVKNMETLILSIQHWINGEDNFEGYQL